MAATWQRSQHKAALEPFTVLVLLVASACRSPSREVVGPKTPPSAVAAGIAVVPSDAAPIGIDAADGAASRDIAQIVTAWSSLASGARTELAFPFVAEAHGVQYLGEPACSSLAVALLSPSSSVDPESWRCLGLLLSNVAPPDKPAEPGACCGWRRGTCRVPPKPAAPYRDEPKRGLRSYCACVPVSADDVCVTAQVGTQGLASIVLDLN